MHFMQPSIHGTLRNVIVVLFEILVSLPLISHVSTSQVVTNLIRWHPPVAADFEATRFEFQAANRSGGGINSSILGLDDAYWQLDTRHWRVYRSKIAMLICYCDFLMANINYCCSSKSSFVSSRCNLCSTTTYFCHWRGECQAWRRWKLIKKVNLCS